MASTSSASALRVHLCIERYFSVVLFVMNFARLSTAEAVIVHLHSKSSLSSGSSLLANAVVIDYEIFM